MMLRLLRVVEEERGANPQLQLAFKDFIQLAASAPLQDTPTPAILCLCCHPSLPCAVGSGGRLSCKVGYCLRMI